MTKYLALKNVKKNTHFRIIEGVQPLDVDRSETGVISVNFLHFYGL